MSVMGKNILIVEDEQEIADTLQYALNSDGFKTHWVSNGMQAKEQLANTRIDLCILDVGLPDCSGFELLKDIRLSQLEYNDIPVMMLTARDEEIDRIVGLEIGADDYVGKPFSPREVVARVKAILKRTSLNSINTDVQLDSKVNGTDFLRSFKLDSAARSIRYNDQPLDFTRAEYLLMQAFLSQPERVFSRRQLIEKVWSSLHPSDDRAIDTHIKTVRAKLRSHNHHQEFIITHRGFVYSFSHEKT